MCCYVKVLQELQAKLLKSFRLLIPKESLWLISWASHPVDRQSLHDWSRLLQSYCTRSFLNSSVIVCAHMDCLMLKG